MDGFGENPGPERNLEMNYSLIYLVGTVQVVACVRKSVARQKYHHDPRYTIVNLKTPR